MAQTNLQQLMGMALKLMFNDKKSSPQISSEKIPFIILGFEIKSPNFYLELSLNFYLVTLNQVIEFLTGFP
jgi:hypothetical protein